MKYLLILFSMLFGASLYGQSNIAAEFTSKTTFDDLVEIRKVFAEKNIILTYKHIELREDQYLKALSFEVSAKYDDGSSTYGSGKLLDFGNRGVITLALNHGSQALPGIDIKVHPHGKR